MTENNVNVGLRALVALVISIALAVIFAGAATGAPGVPPAPATSGGAWRGWGRRTRRSPETLIKAETEENKGA